MNYIPPYVIGGVIDNSLTKVEQKYCSCLMHVRPKVKNPYGICTKSVYGKNKREKVIDCEIHYKYNKYNKKELEAFSKEKHINSRISKDKLVNILDKRKKYILKKY